MVGNRPDVGRFCVVMILPSLLASAAPVDDGIQAEVERSQLIADATQDSYLAGFNLIFDIQFTNRSGNPVIVPDRDRGPAGATWSTLISVQSRQNDGTWKFVIDPGNLMLKADTQFVPCKSLGPKETLEARNVSTRFVVPRSRLIELGSKPTVRFYLVLTCRQPDGQLPTKTVETIPFVISIPALP